MPWLTLEGTFRNGRVELSEPPTNVEGPIRVLVTFLASRSDESSVGPSQALDREAWRRRAFAQMREGFHLGGPPYPRREELHDRDL